MVLLGAACIATVRISSRPRQRLSLPAAPALVLYPLLAGLSVALVFRPGIEVGHAPIGQAVLLLVAAALFSFTVSLRKREASTDAQLLDTPTVDALTRVASHRVFQDRLSHECDRAYRFGDTFMLVMLDLDNFRTINERHGHRIGDRVLLELSRKFRAQLREIDMVARFGGDQFAMILPHTFEKGGVEVAERLRRTIAAWVFPVSTSAEVRLTVSIGVCSYPQDGISPQEMIEAAQKALTFAKAMGGNQVQLSRDLPAREQVGNVVSLPHSGREAIVRSLAAAVDVRDGYTREHSRLVSELSAAIARRIGLPSSDVARISVGALLHDVGKIGVPDAILAKEGKLSPEEWECIREHPELGKRIVEQAPELMDVVPSGVPPSGTLGRHRLSGATAGARTSRWAPASSPRPTPITPCAPTAPTARAAPTAKPCANSCGAAESSSIPGWWKRCSRCSTPTPNFAPWPTPNSTTPLRRPPAPQPRP